MNLPALSKLTIEHLRGSVVPFSLYFEKGKKLTIVYGENGTGKTTICDALEFLAKGKIGSLEGRGLGNKTERYWPSIGKTSSDIAVTLQAGTSTCKATILKGKVIPQPDSLRPKVEILRRGQILRLLEAQPAERYTEISRFIDIAGVTNSEDSLKKLIDNLNATRDTAIAVVLANQTSITQFWEAAGKPGKSALSWAEAEVSRDLSSLTTAASTLAKLRGTYQKLSDYPNKFNEANSALTATQSELVIAERQLENAMLNATDGASELVGILEAATPFLAKHPHPVSCPLCESNENVANLQNTVTQRLAQFNALQVALRNKTSRDQNVQLAKERIATLQADMIRDGKNFEITRREITFPAEIKLPILAAPEKFDELASWLDDTSHLPALWIKCEGAWNEQSKFVATLAKALATYRKNVETQKELDDLLPKLRRAHAILVEERQAFTDCVLKMIAGEVGRLYEIVHPGEGLNKINLELEEGKRASLEVGASFAGKGNTPPQAYFSQSHLDTLGLCVFLALASLDDPENTILVLDDVLASVDEPHVDRLVEMLYTEAAKFRHCIITTHYRPWKQKLRWGWLRNGQCHFIELTRWTLDGGLTHIRSVPDIERLRSLLTEVPPDPQLVCAKAGVVLEATLNFLVELYECLLPKRANGLFTIGELLPALDKKLKQELKTIVTKKDASGVETSVTIILLPIFDELSRIAQARNVFGAHFNELSFELLEDDAITFGSRVLELVEAIADQENGWPRKEKNGSYWANANETRRLYPLKKPI
ncbi:MAG: AAA family ATPase [Gammaproteobacteria bacterium]|nr:MAG: AAA family ATPase [Gammaproteobacteria bacterium]